MTKVFLVEDEFIIRESIKRTVNWNAEGYELVGEAPDGEKAYQEILRCEPDILITDIRMPFMDGLELSRLVQKKLPGTRIIILSGYDDFRYAREAISIGVTEYLLKPVSGAKLLETLGKVREGIDADKQQKDYKAIFEAEHAERLKYERQNFFRGLIAGYYPMAEALDRALELGINLDAKWYCVLLLQIGLKEGEQTTPDMDSELVLGAVATMIDMAEQQNYIGLYEQPGSLGMLVMAEDRTQLRTRIEDEIRLASGIVGESQEVLFFASVGAAVERISEIHQSFQGASRRFAKRFLCEKSTVFTPEDEALQNVEPQFSLVGFDIGKIDRRIIFHFLRSGAVQDVTDFVKSCFAGVSLNNLNSQLVRQYIVMDTYLSTASFLQSTGLSNEEIEDAIGTLTDPSKLGSVEEMMDYLEKIFASALRVRDEKSNSRYGDLVAQAKQIIYEEFTKNELSLSHVAGQVGVSPNHLSRLFGSATGETFVEFVTRLRMERAKELLSQTKMPSSEIGIAVGYSDPHYFYYLFKKTQGCTPKEYRAGGEQ